jgi:hypothetical protein
MMTRFGTAAAINTNVSANAFLRKSIFTDKGLVGQKNKNITVDSKVIKSGLQIKSGLTTIKFFPTAYHAPSKSVAVAADTQAHAHATPTHLLSPSAESYESKFSKPTRWTLTTILSLILFNASGQVVPNLLTNDNYRPYLTEEQKRQEIFKAPKAKTSQELNPDLYKYQNQNQENLDQLIKQGLIPDPNNAFKNQAQIGFSKPTTPTTTNYGIPKSAYEPGLSIQQRNQMMIEADMRAYEEQKTRTQQILAEADKEFGPTINYTLGLHTGPRVDRFVKAYNELESMLNGNQKIDFLKAVWLVESAHDQSLTWEEFSGSFQNGVDIISALMIQDKIDPNDNLSKIMTIYKYMADTTKVYIKAKEKNIVTKPMMYDYEDYGGKQDVTKVFVSKLLRTGSGQCMSLPMLYYLYAKAFRADAHIAFAPQHTYITFQDTRGIWQNIELTAPMFIASDFHWGSGFISAEQAKSGIYLRPSTEKETLTYLLTTLAITYARNFGTDERNLQMAETAKKYFPKSITANMIYAGYYKDLYLNVLRQYDMYQLSEDKFNNDEQRKALEQRALTEIRYLKRDLGYAEIPDWAYKQWLDGVNESARRKQHLVKRRELEQQLNRIK